MIPFNPIGITESFPFFCEALVEFKDPSPELEYMFKNLIQTYKKCLGDQEWNEYLESFPFHLRAQLNNRFKLLEENLMTAIANKQDQSNDESLT